MDDRIKRMTERQCREWADEPMINPLSGKQLTSTAEKSTYDKIRKRCLEKYNITPRTGPPVGEAAPEAEEPEAPPVVPAVPARSRSNTSSRSPTYREVIARRRAAKGESLTANEKWISKRCTNESQDLMTADEITEADIHNIFVIYKKNRQNNWVKKGYCNKRDDFYNFIKDDQISFKSMRLEYPIYNTTNNFLANWVRVNPDRPFDGIGRGGCAGHKLFVKVTGNNDFITLKSYLRIQENNTIKEWYALPLFNKEEQIIGNIQSLFADSVTHGQSPGSIIYKLYTKEEIDSLPNDTITEDDDEYDTLLVKRPRDIWETKLPVDEDKLNIYNRKTIKSILLTKPKVTEDSELKDCKYMLQGIWYRGRDKPGYEFWMNPFDNIGHQYNEEQRGQYNYNQQHRQINGEIYESIYRFVYKYAQDLYAHELTFNTFSKIIEFILYYLTYNSEFRFYKELSYMNKMIFIIAAIYAVTNNEEYVSRDTCIEVIRIYLRSRGIGEAGDATAIAIFNDRYNNDLRNFVNNSHFNDYKSVYDLVMNCGYISKGNIEKLNEDNKFEIIMRYIYSPDAYRASYMVEITYVYRNIFTYPPIYIARRLVRSILEKSNRIFYERLPAIDESLFGLPPTNKLVQPPMTPDNSYRCKEIPFW